MNKRKNSRKNMTIGAAGAEALEVAIPAAVPLEKEV